MRTNKKIVAALAVLSVITLLLLTWIVRSQTFPDFEMPIFYAINSWPDHWRIPFLIITYSGTVYMMALLTLFLLWRKYYRLALRIFCGGVVAIVLTQAVKYIVERPRPYIVFTETIQREKLLVGYGFPSTHTAVVTVMALLLMVWLPQKWRWIPIVWIVLIGLSRIYLGVHAPLDVVGGFAAGVLVVTVSLLLKGKLTFVRNITHLKLSDKR